MKMQKQITHSAVLYSLKDSWRKKSQIFNRDSGKNFLILNIIIENQNTRLFVHCNNEKYRSFILVIMDQFGVL